MENDGMGQYSHCPECGAEYRQGFTECSDCRVPLVGGSAPRTEDEQVPPELELVSVFKAEDLVTLSLAQTILDDAGVVYQVKGKGLQAATAFPLNKPVWLLVSQEDEARAEEALMVLEETGDDAALE